MNSNNSQITVAQEIKSDWKYITGLLLFGLAIHIILWITWPLHAGGDASSYIYYFLDSFNAVPIYHFLMCFRLPVSSFLFGALLYWGGANLVTFILEILALSSILMIYLIAKRWGKWTARIVAIVFILMIPYQVQLHQVTSDGIFAWFVILFLFLLRYALYNESLKLWIFLGITTALATLTRPNGLALVLIILVIFFLKLGWKKVLSFMLVILLSFGIITGGYITYKGIRYQDYSIARGSNSIIFNRVFKYQNSAIKSENGPHTKKYIDLVEKNILTTDIYRDYGVTIRDFLTYRPNSRFWADSVVMVDLAEGWNSNYRLLALVSFEAIKANPYDFIVTFAKGILTLSTAKPHIPDIPVKADSSDLDNTETAELNENSLPIPTEGQLIPESNYMWIASNPSGIFPTEEAVDTFNNKANVLIKEYQRYSGNEKIRRIIVFLWDSFYVPIIFLWVLSILGIIFSRRKDRLYLTTVFLLYIVIIIGTKFGTDPHIRYRLPLDPMILISGFAGLTLFIKRMVNKIKD